MRRIGFIGLGMMGGPMARLLCAAGHQLVVQDTREDVVEAFVKDNAGSVAATASADFRDCDVIITMLPNSAIVDQVIASLVSELQAGSVIVEMSSADPNRTKALAATVAGRGIRLVDAPVSGGVKKAVAGTLAIMVGGDPSTFESVKPVLQVMGQAITHVGPVGSGHALKALNNYVSAAALIATAEAIQVGSAFGIDPKTIVDVINASTGRNNTTENKAHQFMLNGAFNSGFSLALQAKDVGIAAALGRSLDFPMALAQDVNAMTVAASEQLGVTADHTELFRFVGKT